MRFRLNGVDHDLEVDGVRNALRGGAPDGIQDHWVEVDGIRWPPKHALSVAAGIDRGDFTSRMALRQFQRLGFPTSQWSGGPGRSRPTSSPHERSPTGLSKRTTPTRLHVDAADSAAAFAMLVGFLSSGLTECISQAEAALDGADGVEAAAIVERFGMTEELLASALLVRQQAGRLNDVVHATTIVQLLPTLLEPGECVRVRPSLGAGNDSSRPFDLETDRRIAEFKLSFWKGADAMRMRGVFADLVHLAMDDSGRRAQLFVVGARPIHFLRTGSSSAEWALGRSSPRLRARFAEHFGDPSIAVRDFSNGPASHVELIDLTRLVPVLADDVHD
ncbi:hypothetical protein [Geodermatophilus ruber]|uniref:PE-PGRS family protein n=1 Tax=Geodermatophilus ruber TaxID=504800 RepID=A0A1I4H7N2_9ACTN|nr:hypothetical protein [Geodermatophilus ruber]SFL37673.1 hypothetical protein SAMN04488085_11053 [Geodermatophilus ruber]